MNTQRTFSPEDLTAYLDGEADVALARAIDEAKVHMPELRARLEALNIETAQIRAAFDTVLPLAPSLAPSIRKAPEASPVIMPWQAVVATACLCLAIGWGASSLLTHARHDTWQHYAAMYHAMYVTDTLAHVRPTAQTTTEELGRVSRALGMTIKTDALSASDQLDFRRAQVLGFAGRPVAQIAFVSKTGAPVALCIALVDDARSEPVRPAIVLGMRAATWSKGRYQYLLIGGTDAGVVEASAASFAKAL